VYFRAKELIMKLARGMKVLVASATTTGNNQAWGIRVLDLDCARQQREIDKANGHHFDDAGEPLLYSDVRSYVPDKDGSDCVITITALRGKSSYLSVRGVYYAPQNLVQGRTASGSTCWFLRHEVVAVIP